MPTYRHVDKRKRKAAPTQSDGASANLDPRSNITSGNGLEEGERTAHVGRHATAVAAKAPAKRTLPIVIGIVIVILAIAAIAHVVYWSGQTPTQSADSDIGRASETSLLSALDPELSGSSVVADDVVMTLAGSKDTQVLVGEDYIESGCRARGAADGDLTSTVSISGDVDTSVPGTYEVTYTAARPDGAVATATRNVHVVESFEKAAERVPVFMYHYVYDEANPFDDIDNNCISNAKLSAHCEYLKGNGYYYPSFQELRAWVDGKHTLPSKSAILTFDDADISFLQLGIPILAQYEIPATTFVISMGSDADVATYANPYIQFESHTYNMHRAGGGGVGKGGIIHALSADEIYEDAIAANGVLDGDAVAMAYPFGDNNERAWEALDRAGILCAFTVKNDYISQGDNPMALSRIRISKDMSVGSFVSALEAVA